MQTSEEGNNTWITPKDNYGKIPNEQLIVYARSGYSKGLISEGLVEWYHRHGYIIFVISDPKKESEYAYQMFKPIEKYHLDHLKLVSSLVGGWKMPKEHDVILYHPFTNKIPTDRKLPNINFYTIPIKSLRKKEWSMLAEVEGDNETISVLLKASADMNDEEGIYNFADRIRNVTHRESKKEKYDWKTFGFSGSSGTVKEKGRVKSIMQLFVNHPFLGKQNSLYNLNWKEMLQDQKNYHVFLNNFLGRGDEKVCDFLVLYLLESILENKQYLKDPILIVFPELSKQCPYNPKGHKIFLADGIKSNLKTIRSEGRGMSTIGDSQVWGDVDEDVRGSFTIDLFGELGDIKDIENVCKALGYGKGIKEQLSQAEIPRTYLVRGVNGTKPDEGGYLFFYPTAMHCEPEYNFEEMYRKHNKEDSEKYPMKNYKDLVDEMKKQFKAEEEEMKKKIKKREKEQEIEQNKKLEERESRKEENQDIQNNKDKVKQAENKTKETLMKLCYEMLNDPNIPDKDKSFRKIAAKLGIKSHKTVSKYILEYQKKLDEENQSPQLI